MSTIGPDVTERANNRARVVSIEPDSRWRTPSHGRGRLLPFAPGNKLGGRRGTRFTETQALARTHGVDAVMALVERLHDRDGRVAVAAAVAILERAWGKVGTVPPADVQPQVHIDLTSLRSEELAVLVQLADSGRLRPVTTDGPPAADQTEIEGKADV